MIVARWKQFCDGGRRVIRWDGFWWVIGMVGVLIISGGLSWRYWGDLRGDQESLSTTIRNLALVIGGIEAILLAAWRSIVAQRQVAAAHRQADTSQQGLLNERYQRGTEMLGSEVLSVRLGGAYALDRLAAEHQNYTMSRSWSCSAHLLEILPREVKKRCQPRYIRNMISARRNRQSEKTSKPF